MATSAPRPDRQRGPSDLERAADGFRADLADREDRAVAALTRDLQATARRIDRRMLEVLGKIDAAQAAGRAPGVSFLYERGRLEALRNQVAAELRTFGVEVIAQADTLARASGEAAERWSRDLVREAAAGLGIRDADRYVIAPLRPEVIAAARANLVAGAPLAELLDTFGDVGARKVGDALVAGAALGKSPLVVAREIRADVVETYRGRARLIARTEAQRTARTVARDVYRSRPDILAGWRWSSSLDRRTCPACFAQHGTLHPLEETLAGHPGCRCVMLPVLRSELARPGLEPQVRDGADVFAELPPDAQLAILGPGKLRAYQAGEIRLADLAERRDSDRWGPMVREASLERARNAAALRRGMPPAPPAPHAAVPPPAPTPPVAPPAPPPVPQGPAQYAGPLRGRADRLDAIAGELEGYDAKAIRDGARAWRDAVQDQASRNYSRQGKWSAPGSRHVMRGGSQSDQQGYTRNAPNPATRINGRDKLLDDYRADWLAWSRGEPLDFPIPPGVEPVADAIRDRVLLVDDLRQRAKADRRIADVLDADPDDWRFEPRELELAVRQLPGEVEDGQLLLQAAEAAKAEIDAQVAAARAAAREAGAAKRRATLERKRAEREAARIEAERAAAVPQGQAVTSAVRVEFPNAARRAELQAGLDAIDRVHTLPAGARVDVPLPIKQMGKAKTRGGAYVARSTPRGAVPDRITINELVGGKGIHRHQGMVLTHELGHYVDHVHLRNMIPDGQMFASKQALFAARNRGRLANGQTPAAGYETAFVDVYSAILASPTFARLVGVPRAFGTYLRSAEELYARAYAQWIATRSGDRGMLAAVAEELAQRDGRDGDKYGEGLGAWEAEEFEPIAAAFDDLFRELGALR